MDDIAHVCYECDRLAARLHGQTDWGQLRALYLELAPLTAQIQGLVNDRLRAGGTGDTGDLQRALEELKASVRAVGLDMRLASPGALTMGIETALERAAETLELLHRTYGVEP